MYNINTLLILVKVEVLHTHLCISCSMYILLFVLFGSVATWLAVPWLLSFFVDKVINWFFLNMHIIVLINVSSMRHVFLSYGFLHEEWLFCLMDSSMRNVFCKYYISNCYLVVTSYLIYIYVISSMTCCRRAFVM